MCSLLCVPLGWSNQDHWSLDYAASNELMRSVQAVRPSGLRCGGPCSSLPLYHCLDLFSVAPGSSPCLCCVNGQLMSLPWVGIRNSLFCTVLQCFFIIISIPYQRNRQCWIHLTLKLSYLVHCTIHTLANITVCNNNTSVLHCKWMSVKQGTGLNKFQCQQSFIDWLADRLTDWQIDWQA